MSRWTLPLNHVAKGNCQFEELVAVREVFIADALHEENAQGITVKLMEELYDVGGDLQYRYTIAESAAALVCII